jgi:hypothetical protein
MYATNAQFFFDALQLRFLLSFSFITTFIFLNSKTQGVAMNKSKNVVQQSNNPIKHANNEFIPLVHKHRTTTL